MKKLKLILVAIIALAIVTACSKDKNEPNDNKAETTPICAKWIATGSCDYISFEFNSNGNYIVVKKTATKSTGDQNILFGTYENIDNKKIVLSDFGTLIISELADNSISFTIQPISNPDNTITVNASKQEEIKSSANTDLLCQSWEVVSVGGDDMTNCYVVLSKAGTYLISIEFDGEKITGLGTWAWCNDAENKLAFTIDNILDCDGLEIIKDIHLTSSSFTGIDMENGSAEEMIMKPVSSLKSARLANKKTGKKVFGIK